MSGQPDPRLEAIALELAQDDPRLARRLADFDRVGAGCGRPLRHHPAAVPGALLGAGIAVLVWGLVGDVSGLVALGATMTVLLPLVFCVIQELASGGRGPE